MDVFWIVVIAVIVFWYSSLKFRGIKHRIVFNIFLLILMLFLISLYYVYSTNDLNLSNFNGVRAFGGVYYSWLKGALGNLGDITSYVSKQDWTNSTGIK